MGRVPTRGEGAPSPAILDAVRAEQVALLFDGHGPGVPSTPVAGGLLTAVLVWQRTLAVLPAALWLAVLTLLTAGRYILARAYRRAAPGAADWRPWARRAVISTALGGVIWGAALPWLLAEGRFDLQVMVVAMLVIGTYGLVGAAGAYLHAFHTFFVPFLPLVAWFAVQGDLLHLASAALLVVWLPSVAGLGRRYNARLVEALRLRFENAAMAEDLRAAGAAKSRFLAAASHDLRQPVHALGMFVGALRSQPLPEPARRVVAQMESSIGALDGLFGALLDMSTLDAGVVEARPARVTLQPLLARICAELEPEAAAKGVELVLAPTRLEVESDPVLLERILRNLIGNAVRYTEAGWVLVGCRRRDGRVCLEVRDTGAGIPPALQETVFEEFFQVGNPDRDRTRGLGLGLPIVRRLAAILDHPLAMESQPGRGTTFRLLVPRVDGARGEGQAAAGLSLREAPLSPVAAR